MITRTYIPQEERAETAAYVEANPIVTRPAVTEEGIDRICEEIGMPKHGKDYETMLVIAKDIADTHPAVRVRQWIEGEYLCLEFGYRPS